MPVDKLRGDIRHLIFAGQGGFFVPLTLMTMVLGQHPDLQERAREEVMAVSPDGPVTMEQIDADGVPRPALEGGPPLLRDELRDFFGKAKEDMEIGGYRIPKGWGAIGAIHINMRNPERLRRPRHLRPRAVHARARGRAARPAATCRTATVERNHHRCPGEDIVTVAVKLYLTLLLRKLDWTAARRRT